MIKRLLNRLSLSRILSILVLYLLLPTTAWGQTFSTGKFQVTGDQSPYTYKWCIGSDDSYYWETTFNNATCTGLNDNNEDVQIGQAVGSFKAPLTFQNTDNELATTVSFRLAQSRNISLTSITINLESFSNGVSISACGENFTSLSTENGNTISFSLPYIWNDDISITVSLPQGSSVKISSISITTGTYLGVTVKGIAVTSGVNEEDVLGDGKVSFTAASGDTPATLTLSGANINMSDGGYVVESSIENLNVTLVGNNIATCANYGTDKGGFKYTGTGSSPKITFKTNSSDYNDFGSFKINGIYSMSQFFSGYSARNSDWLNEDDNSEDNGWRYHATENPSNVDPYVRVGYRRYYDLWFGYHTSDGTTFYRLHSDREGDYFEFEADKSLLRYNYYLPDYVFKSRLPQLTVQIDESAMLSQFVFESTSSTQEGTIVFTKDQENNYTPELTLECSDGVIIGFSQVLFENGMKVKSPSPAPTLWDNTVTSAIISDNLEYDLSVDGIQVSDANANDVLGDGSGSVSYKAGTNTLTLKNARLTQRIFFGNESLIIDLEGASSITTEQDAAIATEEGTLTIMSSNKKGSLSLTSSGGNGIIQGMETVNITKPLVSSANLTDPQTTSATIHPVSAPIMVNRIKEDSGLRVLLYNPDDNGGAGTIKYSVTYADQSTGVTNQTYSSEGLLIAKPGTLTAWVELDSGDKSSNLVGKYFRYKQNPTKVVFNGTDPVTFTPELEPAIESTDNISVSFTSGDVDIDNNTATISAFGSYMITGQLTYDSNNPTATMVLNPDTIKVNVQAVPATPTIVKEDRTYISTEKITINSSTPSGTTICYKWGEGSEQTYDGPITVKAGTLHAWVKYTDGASGGSVSVYSNPAEATFTVIPDISELTFTPSSIDNITYTGRAITPSVAITKNGETVSSDNYTVKTVQEIEGEQTVVEAINVGSYTLVIEGKNEYGGKKEMPFTISQADMASIAIEEIATQTYTGEDLTPTLSVKLGEVTVSSDEYTISYTKDGATATEIKEAGTYTVTLTSTDKNFSTTNTKSTTFTIKAASASISAENQTATYTGSDIEYDKSKITVEPASLSSSITTTYYATNPDDSQANTPSPMGSAPKNIGQYWVVIGLSNANYQASQTVTLTILPPKPTITPEGGQQRYDTTITLAKPYDVPGADIYYSWNNGADSTVYENPINVETGTLKAWMIVEYMGVDVAGGKYKSEVATATFTRQEDPALSFIGQDNKTIETAEYTIGGSDQSLPTLMNTHNVTVSLESSSPQVATINDGVVTPVGVGTTTITVSSPATEGYIAGNASYTLTVYKSLSHESISITVADVTYNGEPQTPTVTVKDGETTLTKAETSDGTGDYTVAYSNNTLAAASTDNVAPTVTITGKGNYKGEVSRTFTISTATMTITAEGYNGTYDGKAHGITVAAPEGATVTYGTKKGTYNLNESPTYTDAGTYMVHYQVVKTNYTTIADSAKVEITKATPSITFDKESYSTTYGEIFNAPTASTNPEGLTVTATSSSNTQVATVADGAISIIGIGETTITVSFAGNNNYEAATTTYKLNVVAGAITGITATGYTGTYDGKAHGITVVALEGATVTYGTKKGTYDKSESPTYTDAGSYMVHYQVVKTNYATIADSAKVEITKATPSITFDEESYTATYGAEFTAPTASTNPEGLTVTATSSSNTQVAAVADGVITITGIGETTITVSFAGNNNYEAATTTYKLNVAAGAIIGVTATGYSDVYDGKAHGITVTAPEGATIKYGTKKGTYNFDQSPTYSDAGTYMVHYQVECTNYTTLIDSVKVEITKANITPSITLEGWTFGATANTPKVTGNTGNGAETFTYKAEGADAFTSEVPTAVGTHTVKVTIAETTNYNGGEATTTFAITNRTIDPAKDITFAEGQSYASFYSANEDLVLPESGIAVYMITGIEGNTLTTQAVSYIPKGVPVLIEKTETAVEAMDPSEIGTNMLQYATEDVAASGTLYILYNGEYVKATGTIPQGKCYLKLNKPSGARILTIGNNNGTTSISNFNADTETDRWFDLNGQRISKPQKKGLYIKNGKKIVVN